MSDSTANTEAAAAPQLDPSNHWRIVVGFDGSAADSAALAWALDVADAFDAEVLVCHAVGLLEGGRLRTHPEELTEIQARMQAVIDGAGSVPVGDARATPVRLIVQAGDPVDVVLAVVHDERPQMVVLGRREAGSASNSWLGSVSRELVSRCPVATVVVPSTSGAPPEHA